MKALSYTDLLNAEAHRVVFRGVWGSHASPIAPLNDVLRNYAAKAFCRKGE